MQFVPTKREFQRATEAVQRVLSNGSRRRHRNFGLASRCARAALTAAYFSVDPSKDLRYCPWCKDNVRAEYRSRTQHPEHGTLYPRMACENCDRSTGPARHLK